MEKLTQKWCVIALLEDTYEGYEFHKGEWLLHITLAGVHAVGWHSEQLQEDFSKLIQSFAAFTVTSLEQGHLGPKSAPTKVVFIEKSDELMSLHEKIISYLEEHGADFNNPEWTREGYIPHSTVKRHDMKLETNTAYTIRNLALVDMFPNENGDRRKIYRIFTLSE